MQHADRGLNRRQLLQTAGMLTVAGLQGCAARAGALRPDLARRRAATTGRRELEVGGPPIMQVLASSLNAPSPHNTQPWLFKLLGEREALLYVDRTRLLPRTDPPARQVHIGCGCLIEAFALGATSFGWAAQVSLFPQGAYTDLAQVGHAPVARLALSSRAAAADPLAPQIHARQTSRLPYLGDMVTDAEFARIVATARVAPAGLRLLSGAAMNPYLELLDRAMEREFRTLTANEETRRWFRFDDQEAEAARDGLTFETNGITGFSATLARWFTSDTKASWNSDATIAKGLGKFREALYTARGLVILSSASNTYRDHLEAGRRCYRLMLALTQHGMFCHPVNQVLQEYAEMTEYRVAFEKLSGVHPPAKAQMLLRIGRSEVPALSYRRPVRSVILSGDR